MRFPFTIKRAPGLVYAWDRNDWFRRHGYQMPIDSYLILQWTCLILLDAGFFLFLVYFTTEYGNISISPTKETTIENLKLGYILLKNSYIEPFDTWTCKISFFQSRS
jgi:hypothetical protein